MKGKIVLISTALLIVLAVIGGYWYWTTTPNYSIQQIKKSIENHDVTTFKKHVDTKSLSNRFVDDVIDRTTNENLSSGELDSALGAGIAKMMKPRLTEALEEQIIRLVERGGITENDTEVDSGEASLDNLADNIGFDENQISGIEYINKQGKTAYLGLGFEHAQLDTTMIIELLMRDLGSYWQVAEFSNINELINQVTELEKSKLAELNEPIRDKISQTLEVISVVKSNRSDDYGFDKKVVFQLRVKNISDKTIKSFIATIHTKDSDGESLKDIRIRNNTSITPQKVDRRYWSIDVNMFESETNRLYEISNDQIQIDVTFRNIVFEDDSELKILESLKETSS